MPPPATRQDPKLLFRRLDGLIGGLDSRQAPAQLLMAFLDQLLASMGQDLRLRAGMLYSERGGRLILRHRAGPDGGPERRELPLTLAPLALLLKHRTYIFPDPGADASPSRAGMLGPSASAAILLGQPPDRFAFFFQLEPGWLHDETDFALNTVRAALDSRLLERRLRDNVLEAVEIQRSLLVERPPSFSGYDIACRSVAAEEVGGDFYDFISFDNDWLGIAVGDASGHGLPAALLVRDVVTGLRMGIEKDLKVVPVFHKLNRVIHSSRLTSRFVSLFYGELENNGNFIYVNAGHQPPLLFNARGVEELSLGGTVIGPLAEATFKRGFAHLDRGGTLVLCTDGLMERQGPGGEMFGVEGLRRLVQANPGDSAEQLLDRLFREVHAFGSGQAWEDDATAMVVKREGGS